MKLLSIRNLWSELKSVLKRFPLVMSMALLGTAAGVLLVDSASYFLGEEILVNVLITSVLGFLLFLALRFYTERNTSRTGLFQIVAGSFLVLYYLLLPDHYQGNEFEHVLRSILYGIAFFMAITFSPFIKHEELNGFWQHNRHLFTRVFFTGLYTGTLYLGLVLALASLESLFDISIRSEFYFELWIAVVGLVATSFFLAGIPKKLSSLNVLKDYPKGIRVFSQYILLPLLGLYFVILYAYTAKILFTGVWPEGIVSTLIMVFSFVAIFTSFLLHPLTSDKAYPWVARFSKWIYVFIIPMVAILFWAISIRVGDYGLTERRYYVIAIGLWLLSTSVYFIFSKKKSLKFIPISLFFISLMTSFGPWGALGLSQSNQIKRLESLLTENNLILNGFMQPATNEVPVEAQKNIQNILYYLSSYHGLSVLEPWVPLDFYFPDDCLSQVSCFMTDVLGLESQQYSYYNDDFLNLYLPSDSTKQPVDITGFTQIIPDIHYFTYSDSNMSVLNEIFYIELEDKQKIEIELSEWLAGLKGLHSKEASAQDLTIKTDAGMLILDHLNIKNLGKSDQVIESFNGTLLLP